MRDILSLPGGHGHLSIARETVALVLHDTVDIIGVARGASAASVEIVALVRNYVVAVYGDVIVPIWATLLMVETQGVDELMLNDSSLHAAATQTQDLMTPLNDFSNLREATTLVDNHNMGTLRV